MKSKAILLTVFIFAVIAAGSVVTKRALFVVGERPKMIVSGKAAIGGPFTLIATDGSAVSDQSYKGKWQVIYFGYTFCPDACPIALNSLSLALEKLGASAANLQALFITVDPERDTRQVLSDYMKAFDSRIVALTGDNAQIDKMIKEYKVFVAPQKKGGDADYAVDHTAYFYLMDPQGAFIDVLAPDSSGEEIADRLREQMSRSNG